MYKYASVVLFLGLLAFLVFRDWRPVTASSQAIISAPIDEVWRLQTDISGWKEWNTDIESMEVDGEVGLGTSFIWKAGGITIESRITEYAPKSKIGWHGKALGIDADHIWTFTETESGVRVYTEETFTGPLAWLLPGTMRDQIDKALRHGVSALKRTAEKGRTGPDQHTQTDRFTCCAGETVLDARRSVLKCRKREVRANLSEVRRDSVRFTNVHEVAAPVIHETL